MALIGEMKYLTIGSNTYEIPTSELPIASSSTLGGIKVGTNLSIDSSTGVLSASFTETDPTVPSWAKASTKPTYTASEVGAVPKTAGDSYILHASSIQGAGLLLYKDSIKFQTNVGDTYPYVGISRGNTTQLNLITSESGQVILNNVATPTSNYHAANKLYVDTRSLPTGGTTGQVLKKTSSTNYDVEWGAVDALPVVSSSDNNKVLTVVNGAWAAASLPIYNGGVS